MYCVKCNNMNSIRIVMMQQKKNDKNSVKVEINLC